MRAVIQRVSMAQVVVEDKKIADIKQGILVLIGFTDNDNGKAFTYMLDKIINLRIFEDDNDKMNLSVKDIDGEVILVPNFTLYGDCKHGRRPSYITAASPERAKSMFDDFCSLFQEAYTKTQFGQFQAEMKVTLLNDGPVTLLLDSDKLI